MTLSDLSIIVKKVLVGIIVTALPFIIIYGGLWLTKKLLSTPAYNKKQVIAQPKRF